MQNLAREIRTPHERIQERWRQGELPHFSGIVFGDGRMIVMNESTLYSGELGELIQVNVSPLCETSIDSFHNFGGEYVEVTQYVPSLDLGAQLQALHGEGAMGSEGFVALLWKELLLWSAFFTISNPFYKLRLGADDKLIATSTHEVEWRFPVDAPWQVEVGRPLV